MGGVRSSWYENGQPSSRACCSVAAKNVAKSARKRLKNLTRDRAIVTSRIDRIDRMYPDWEFELTRFSKVTERKFTVESQNECELHGKAKEKERIRWKDNARDKGTTVLRSSLNFILPHPGSCSLSLLPLFRSSLRFLLSGLLSFVISLCISLFPSVLLWSEARCTKRRRWWVQRV